MVYCPHKVLLEPALQLLRPTGRKADLSVCRGVSLPRTVSENCPGSRGAHSLVSTWAVQRRDQRTDTKLFHHRRPGFPLIEVWWSPWRDLESYAPDLDRPRIKAGQAHGHGQVFSYAVCPHHRKNCCLCPFPYFRNVCPQECRGNGPNARLLVPGSF